MMRPTNPWLTRNNMEIVAMELHQRGVLCSNSEQEAGMIGPPPPTEARFYDSGQGSPDDIELSDYVLSHFYF